MDFIQHLQNGVFISKKGLNGQKHPWADFHPATKKSDGSPKFPILPLGGEIFLSSSNVIWKTLLCFTFESRDVEIISTYFSVWLWNVTQFDTPKNEMSLKARLVIRNGFLIAPWKYGIWISNNESIIRTTAPKGVDYSSIQNCVWTCHLVSVWKILTSLLDKSKRMT